MHFLWNWLLFGVMTAGSVVGVFYPTIVSLFKANQPDPKYHGLGNTPGPGKKISIFIAMGIVIGLVLSLLAFGSFLGDAESQKKLFELGFGAYFLAFAAGYTAASAAEELARK
jgi:hypothetical protein